MLPGVRKDLEDSKHPCSLQPTDDHAHQPLCGQPPGTSVKWGKHTHLAPFTNAPTGHPFLSSRPPCLILASTSPLCTVRTQSSGSSWDGVPSLHLHPKQKLWSEEGMRGSGEGKGRTPRGERPGSCLKGPPLACSSRAPSSQHSGGRRVSGL